MGKESGAQTGDVDTYRHPVIELRLTPDQFAIELILSPYAWLDQQNLIGKLEGWGIGPATPVTEVTIKVSAATGAQVKELLKKLPDGMTFELTLEKEDN